MISKSNITRRAGFTLIEVIATLIVVGILAAFFIHFMGTALNHSWKSAELVAGEGQAEGKLEEILADYVARINDNPDTALAAIKATNYGSDVNMVYIEFDNAGNETSPASGVSNNLKVTIEAPGYNLTTLLTKSRKDTNDPKIKY